MSKRDKIDTSGCYFCARQTDIHAHHIVPDRFNGKETRENLVGVCERCHKKLERLYDKRFYERLGIDDSTGERKNHFPCTMNCNNRGKVRLSFKGFNGWYCLQHATEMCEHHDFVTIHEDLTGRIETRNEWIQNIEEVSRNAYERSND